MNKKSKIIAILGTLIILIFIGLYLVSESYRPKFRWDENYKYQNEQPYGLKLLFDIISNDKKKNALEVISTSPKNALKNSDTSSLYMFIGANFTIDSADSKVLSNFVKRGNNVFISSIASRHLLFDILTNENYPFFYYHGYQDSLITITFDQSSPDSVYQFDHKFGKKITMHPWNGMENSFVEDTLAIYGFESISHLNDSSVDCFRVKHGKGWFVFHFNPICFSNYSLTKENGLNYFNRLLTEYKKKKIYWDEFSKSPLISDYHNSAKQSPLRFILSERSLRWTWYLICFFVLLYIIFNSKRKQAYIPLIPENRNTTIEYIQSLATLHYNKTSLHFMADEILKQFQNFVKHKYNFSFILKKDKMEVAKQLAPKSGIKVESLNEIFKNYYKVKYDPNPESKNLIAFYISVEYFYKNCK